MMTTIIQRIARPWVKIKFSEATVLCFVISLVGWLLFDTVGSELARQRGTANASADIERGDFRYHLRGLGRPWHKNAIEIAQRDYGILVVRTGGCMCSDSDCYYDQAYNRVLENHFIQKLGFDPIERAFELAHANWGTEPNAKGGASLNVMAPSTESQEPTNTAARNSVSNSGEQEIRQLIERLASRNSPPTGDGWLGLNRPSDWKEEHEKTVDDARDQLKRYGKEAFPLLLENLNDQRYSLTASYSVEVNHSVGHVCGMIVESNVDLIGMTYKSRDGTDRQSHMCPLYFSKIYRGDYQKWWQENNRKSLKQMRVDVLKWRIEREEEIGFPNAESRKLYLQEIEHQLAEVEAGP